MSKSHKFRNCAALLALPALLACYHYVPVPIDELQVGVHTRTRVTLEQAAAIGEITGNANRLVEGDVVGLEGDHLLLSVPAAAVTAGLATRILHQRVNIPQSGIIEVETRRLDRPRTFLVIGAGAAIASIIVVSQFIAADNPEGGGKPNPDQIYVPLLRIRR